MDVSPLVQQGVPIIQGYKNRVFKISGTTYDHDVVVNKDGVRPWDRNFDALSAYDVLIHGTGDTQIWPPAELKARINHEVMTTPAACRTYNALIAEGRDITAILQLCNGLPLEK